MTMWHHELNSRSDEERMCVKGKMDAATFTQTKVSNSREILVRELFLLNTVKPGSIGFLKLPIYETKVARPFLIGLKAPLVFFS